MKRIAALSASMLTVLFLCAPVAAQETPVSDAQKTTKTKSVMSWQAIGQKMNEYKGVMKEIAGNAEKSLKKMDEEKRLRESNKVSAKLLNDKKEAEKKALKEAAVKAKRAAKQKAADEAAAKAKLSADAKAAQAAAAKAKKAAEKKAAQEAAAMAKKAASQKAADEAAAKASREVEKKIAEEAAIKANKEAKLGVMESTRVLRPQPVLRLPGGKAKEVKEIKKESSAPATKKLKTTINVEPAALVSLPVLHTGKRHLIDEPAPEVQVPVATEDVSSMYREAVALYWDNKYSEAKAKFEQVQKALPEYARTSYYLGRVKEKLNK